MLDAVASQLAQDILTLDQGSLFLQQHGVATMHGDYMPLLVSWICPENIERKASAIGVGYETGKKWKKKN